MDAITYYFSTTTIWIFIVLGGFFTWFSSTRRNILLAFAASLSWFAGALWIWFSVSPTISLTQDWSKILAWVFIMLTFVPWLLFADTEVRVSKDGKSWSEYGNKPAPNVEDASVKYKRELQSRLGRVRRR